MKIFLTTLSGKAVALHGIEPSWMVKHLKTEVSKKLRNLPAQQMSLLFDGVTLDDAVTLADSNVQADTMLHQKYTCLLKDSAGCGDFLRAVANSSRSDAEIVSMLDECGDAPAAALLRATDEVGLTPLALAAMHGRRSICKLLLDRNVDVHLKSRLPGRVAPIAEAAVNGNASVLELLLGRGADPNDGEEVVGGNTPILCTIMQSTFLPSSAHGNADTSQLDCVKLLIKHGADLEHKDKAGISALSAAAINGLPSICQLLIEHDADIHASTATGLTPAMQASYYGHLETLEVLLNATARIVGPHTHDRAGQKIVDVNAVTHNGWSSLMYAVYSGHDDCVTLLIERGADITSVNGNGQTAVDLARTVSVVNALLDNGATLELSSEATVKRLLQSAAAEDTPGHVALMNRILDLGDGIDIDTCIGGSAYALCCSGATLLTVAVCKDFRKMANLLLQKGANPAVLHKRSMPHRRSFGSSKTPTVDEPLLCVAVRNGNIKFVKMVLGMPGAVNVNLRTSAGRTALAEAAFANQADVVDLLHGTSAALALGDPHFLAALLHNAVIVNDPDEVLRVGQLCTSMGYSLTAIFEVENNDGHTATSIGAIFGYVTIWKLYLDHFGVDVDILGHACTTHTARAPYSAPYKVSETVKGMTPLMFAAKNGHSGLIEFLLDRGANIAAVSENELTPLAWARQNKRYEAVGVLIDREADVEAVSKGQTELAHAISDKDDEMVTLLLAKGARITPIVQYAKLCVAVNAGDLEATKQLVEGENVCPYPPRPPTEIEAGLQRRGPLVDAASRGGNLEMLRLLLKWKNPATFARFRLANLAGVEPRDSHDHAHLRNLNRLLKQFSGASFEILKKEALRTALHYTRVFHQDFEMMKILLEHDADPNVANGYGSTQIMEYAAKYKPQEGAIRRIKLLLKHQADINLALREPYNGLPTGSTPLMSAATKGDVDATLMLLHFRASPGSPYVNEAGDTALACAAKKAHVPAMLALMAYGGDARNTIRRLGGVRAASKYPVSIPLLLHVLDGPDYWGPLRFAAAARLPELVVKVLHHTGPVDPRGNARGDVSPRLRMRLSLESAGNDGKSPSDEPERYASGMLMKVAQSPDAGFQFVRPCQILVPPCRESTRMIRLATRGWTPSSHRLYHSRVQEAVHTVMLVAARIEIANISKWGAAAAAATGPGRVDSTAAAGGFAADDDFNDCEIAADGTLYWHPGLVPTLPVELWLNILWYVNRNDWFLKWPKGE